MNLEIVSVNDPGVLKDERVVLRALSDIDIGEYLIADTTYQGEGSVSNKLRHVFWLPDNIVEPKDLIVIYTKKGVDKSRKNKRGNQSHFIYWGLEKSVWNKDEDAVTLFHIRDWCIKRTNT